jgi:WhiB family redox-sensing transcriptional regulator
MSTITRHATTATANRQDWIRYAACAGVDTEIFFPVGNKHQIAAQEADAKRVCQGCPVRARCLEWALETGQHAGVWGGLSEDERRGLSRVPEPSMDRCLNRQEWIEEQMAASVPQKAIARELGVDTGVLCRAVQRFRNERALDEAVKSWAAV